MKLENIYELFWISNKENMAALYDLCTVKAVIYFGYYEVLSISNCMEIGEKRILKNFADYKNQNLVNVMTNIW